MKQSLYSLFLFIALGVFAACNEEVKMDVYEQRTPEITAFTPSDGVAGTEIRITGHYLRDVAEAAIGGVKAEVLYKLSQEEIVIVVPSEGARSGKITLSTLKTEEVEAKQAESEQAFVVTYPAPMITHFPEMGKVGDNIEILGKHLNGVTQVRMGETLAEIVYQSETEIVVKMPFVLEDQTTVSLTYLSDNGSEASLEGELNGLSVEKDKPEVEPLATSRLTESETLILTGKNLNLIEYIYFGTNQCKASFQDATSALFTVPAPEQTATMPIRVTYYNETKEIVLSEACLVIRKGNLYAANQYLGSRNSAYGYGNMLNGNAANGMAVCEPCVLRDEAYKDQIDFGAYVNSPLDFGLNSPDNILSESGGKNNLRNYWCGTTSLAGSDGGFVEYAAFAAVQTRFLILDKEENSTLIEKIRAEKEQLVIVPELFEGLSLTRNNVRTRKKSEAEGLVSTQVFDAGSVIVFYNSYKKKYGILDVQEVYVDYAKAQNINNGDKNNPGVAYIKFNLYYQR